MLCECDIRPIVEWIVSCNDLVVKQSFVLVMDNQAEVETLPGKPFVLPSLQMGDRSLLSPMLCLWIEQYSRIGGWTCPGLPSY